MAPRVSQRVAFDASPEPSSSIRPLPRPTSTSWIWRCPSGPRDGPRYAKPTSALDRDELAAAPVRAALDLLASPNAPPLATVAFLDTAKAKQDLGCLVLHRECGGLGEAAVAAARAFTRSRHGPDSVDAERQRGLLGRALAYRGHMREAVREPLDPPPMGYGRVEPHRGRAGRAGAVAAGFAAAWLEILLREGSVWSPAGLPWWMGRGETGIDLPARVAGANPRAAPPRWQRVRPDSGATRRRRRRPTSPFFAGIPPSRPRCSPRCRTRCVATAISTAFNEHSSCRLGSRMSRRQRSSSGPLHDHDSDHSVGGALGPGAG